VETIPPLTPEELEQRAAQANLSALQETDSGMARIVEDIVVHLTTGEPLPQVVMDKVNHRRGLRGQVNI